MQMPKLLLHWGLADLPNYIGKLTRLSDVKKLDYYEEVGCSQNKSKQCSRFGKCIHIVM